MSVPNLNLRCDFLDHPKTKRLVHLLGPNAEMLLIRLWSHCGLYSPKTGRLEGFSDIEVESMAGWKGEPGKALAMLEKLAWVRKRGDEWEMCGWREHQGHIYGLKLRNRKVAQARWAKLGSSGKAMPLVNHKDTAGMPFPTVPAYQLSKGKGGKVGGAEMVVRDRELVDVKAAIARLEANRESHTDHTPADREELKRLRTRERALRTILGREV